MDRVLAEKVLDAFYQFLGRCHAVDLGRLGHHPVGVRRLELEEDRALPLVFAEDGLELVQDGIFKTGEEDPDDHPLGLLLQGLGKGHHQVEADPAAFPFAAELALDPDELAFPQVGAGLAVGFGKGHDVDTSGHVLEKERGHPLVLFRLERFDHGDDAGNADILVEVLLFVEVADVVGDKPVEPALEPGQGMARDIESQGVHLVRQEERLVPLPHLADLGRDLGRFEDPSPEQEVLLLGRGLLDLVAVLDHPVQHVEALGASPAQGVEDAGLDQALQGLPVDDLRIRVLEQVERRRERPMFPAEGQQLADGRLADVLDRRQPEADVPFLHGEGIVALVDVGRQDLEAHFVALGDVLDDLGRRSPLGLGGDESGQEVPGVMGFEVGRLVGQIGIGRAVGLVEAVFGELGDLVEDLGRLALGDAVLLRALDEALLLGLHDVLDLLAHGLAQDIGVGQGEPGQLDGDAHDLLLVDDDPPRLLEDGLELGELVGRPLGVVLAVDEFVGHAALERPGPVEGVQGDEVPEDLGPESPQEVLHPRALELEDAVGVAGLEQLERLRVVQGDVVNVQPLPRVLLDEVEGVVDDRQVAQAQQVHLEQADIFDIAHLELGRDLPLDRLVEGDEFHQRFRGDDDARGVDRGMADLALELLGDGDELGDLWRSYRAGP